MKILANLHIYIHKILFRTMQLHVRDMRHVPVHDIHRDHAGSDPRARACHNMADEAGTGAPAQKQTNPASNLLGHGNHRAHDILHARDSLATAGKTLDGAPAESHAEHAVGTAADEHTHDGTTVGFAAAESQDSGAQPT